MPPTQLPKVMATMVILATGLAILKITDILVPEAVPYATYLAHLPDNPVPLLAVLWGFATAVYRGRDGTLVFPVLDGLFDIIMIACLVIAESIVRLRRRIFEWEKATASLLRNNVC
ncbi:hypothetical protein IAT38_003150 [Cryptococcus sp. DSM 104549]